MDRIEKAFIGKKALITYVTGGDPSMEMTVKFIETMAKAGADIVEVGIPFSDPVSEGEVIQRANLRAMKNKVNCDDIFNIVVAARKKTDIPILLLTYINPVFKYGIEDFFSKCSNVGVDGVIIPDLPFEEKGLISNEAQKNGICIIPLVSPVSGKRIKKITRDAKGFVYAVSSMGVTGTREKIQTDIGMTVKTIKEATKTPVAVGFGISGPSQAKEISELCDGVIIGSAIVKILEKYKDQSCPNIDKYIRNVRNSIDFQGE